MKQCYCKICFFILLSFVVFASKAQDVIVRKSTERLLVKIISIDSTYIYYKKYNLENKKIDSTKTLTIPVGDVLMIFFSDGSREVFDTFDNNETAKSIDDNNKQSFNKYGHLNVYGKQIFKIGVNYSVFNQYKKGNLNEFWNYVSKGSNTPITTKSGIISFNLGTMGAIDSCHKNYLGADLQLEKTISGALSGFSDYNATKKEFNLSAYFIDVSVYYQKVLNKQKTLFVNVEPGINLGLMNGSIYVLNAKYLESINSGIGWHISTGINYKPFQNVGFKTYFGYRKIKIHESHADPSSPTGYSSFGINGSTPPYILVDWSGFYCFVGCFYSFGKY